MGHNAMAVYGHHALIISESEWGIWNTVESLLMATLSIMAIHLGPYCIEIIVLNIKPLICGHPSIMAEIFGPNGGHYRGVPLYNTHQLWPYFNLSKYSSLAMLQAILYF